MTDRSAGITPQELLEAAQEVLARMPTARLVKNAVGNLAIEVDGEYVGFLDLATAEVEIFEDDTPG